MCIQIGIAHSIESDVDFGCTGGKPEVWRGRLKVEVHDFMCQCPLQSCVCHEHNSSIKISQNYVFLSSSGEGAYI